MFKKSAVLNGLIANFFQTLKEEITLKWHKFYGENLKMHENILIHSETIIILAIHLQRHFKKEIQANLYPKLRDQNIEIISVKPEKASDTKKRKKNRFKWLFLAK